MSDEIDMQSTIEAKRAYERWHMSDGQRAERTDKRDRRLETALVFTVGVVIGWVIGR